MKNYARRIDAAEQLPCRASIPRNGTPPMDKYMERLMRIKPKPIHVETRDSERKFFNRMRFRNEQLCKIPDAGEAVSTLPMKIKTLFSGRQRLDLEFGMEDLFRISEMFCRHGHHLELHQLRAELCHLSLHVKLFYKGHPELFSVRIYDNIPRLGFRHINPDGTTGGWVSAKCHFHDNGTFYISYESRITGNAIILPGVKIEGQSHILGHPRIENSTLADSIIVGCNVANSQLKSVFGKKSDFLDTDACKCRALDMDVPPGIYREISFNSGKTYVLNPGKSVYLPAHMQAERALKKRMEELGIIGNAKEKAESPC